MVRSVARKLYELDSSVIEEMARNSEAFTGWQVPAFSYDKEKVRGDTKIQGTEIYMLSGFSASGCIEFIRALLRKYDLDVSADFIYSARSNKKETTNNE